MPTAYIYRGTFQVRAGETLRYVEVAADGTIAPEVAKSYAELAGIGSLSVPAVSLTPAVTAPSLSGVQIGDIAGASVSLQPAVSPAAVSGVQVGSVAAAVVNLTPTVATPSVVGVQVGSISAAAVSLRPTVAVGTLTGVTEAAQPVNVSDDFNRADGALGSNWSIPIGKSAPVISSGRVVKTGDTFYHAAYWSANTFTADQWAIARVYPETLLVNEGVAVDTLTLGPAVRMGGLGYHVSATNFNDLYDTELTGFTVTLWKNGVKYDDISHYTSGTTNEYTHLKITAVGSTVAVYGGQSTTGPWTQLMIYTDSSPITSGSAGIVTGEGSYATLDDWSGGTV